MTRTRLFVRHALLLPMVFATAALLGQERPVPPGPARPAAGPKAYGVKDYTVTTVPAIAFYPETNSGGGSAYYTSGSKGRYGDTNVTTQFWAPIDLPAGIEIDFIGLNSNTDVPNAFTAQILGRYSNGILSTPIATVSSTVHGWNTDFNASAANVLWSGQEGGTLLLNVQQSAYVNPEYFGWVEIWWKRLVSPPPVSPTFGDVPPSDFGFQYIEALVASGVTGGCGGGNYCPDSPVTRRQMAIFLAKALGLHWPGVSNP